ncbi:MAG: hypothetical protein GX041_04195 [Clostridiales bacterium]|jgi:hypothetical protein|nr:hypothetical protein [Clostridiales bacterium]
MLGKLLKYEIKATARLFLPLYAALLVFSIINRFLNPFAISKPIDNMSAQLFIGIISMTFYYVLLVGTLVMTVVIMIQRFYKNLLGDEGYLMFTLPVQPWHHITSKLLVSILWTILSFGVTAGSIALIANIKDLGKKLTEIIRAIRHITGDTALFLIPVFILTAIAFYNVMIYTAITLGHLFQKHKIIASFGMFCVLYFIYQLLAVLVILIMSSAFLSPITPDWKPTPYEINVFLISLILLAAGLTTVNFYITNTILNKRLNLE